MTSAVFRHFRVHAATVGAAALAFSATAAGQGSTMAQDDWVQTSAISWSGGVRVASGDVSGDASAEADEHEIEYTVVAGQAPPPRGPGMVTSPPAKPRAKEMDRASTKLAQFAINGNSPGPCRVGTKYPSLRLDDGRNRWLLTDVAVVGCGGGMTVTYATRSAR